MEVTSLAHKLLISCIAGICAAALWLSIGNGGNIPWLPPTLVFLLVGISISASIILPFMWQKRESQQNMSSQKVGAIMLGVIRYTIAFNLCRFGWAKLFGLQFQVPHHIAELQANQLSGEWLTWYYFSHSYGFTIVTAVVQIGGAYLLLFKRTLLLGAVLLFAFMFPLTLINIFYQMNVGALLQSVVISIGILYILLLHYQQLVDFFLKKSSFITHWGFTKKTKSLLRLGVVLLSLAFTFYLKWGLK